MGMERRSSDVSTTRVLSGAWWSIGRMDTLVRAKIRHTPS